MDDLVKELRNPKGTSGSDFNASYWFGLANKAADRIEQLKAALRKLDDMIYELDAGDLDLYEVGDFIDAALGEKKDD